MSWNNFLIPFFIGGTSRSLASISLLPINVVRMRLQMKSYTDEEVRVKNLTKSTNIKEEVRYTGMIDCATKIMKYEGVKGFYKGLTPAVLKIFPTSGLFFIGYEATLGYLCDEKRN